ncbi:hypothetical protein PACTADRAFT_51393 [Pachysolen tannophilus NRRL Y-2460]|uniref:Sulfate adenylyltransferase n=1 Tax=Pachysolen tannophilus NRRL Y-2460 TaxID=669874 RepID=A0A1E4TPC8_PACTA|nr:hypothetical protein PACTADRAFT_51393 [Pachysolen tannophilus NRRL Y-2460]
MPVPHGGKLEDLIARDSSIKNDLLKEVHSLKSIVLTERQLCDLELILNGGFSPLTSFMNEKDYTSVVENMRLANGLLWTMPITLDLSKTDASKFSVNERVTLRDLRDDKALAIITIEDIYVPNKQVEGEKVFRGVADHPAVKYLNEVAGDVYIGGQIQAISLPTHYDYTELRKTPAQLRAEFANRNWSKIVAFQTRNPMHRAHRELTVRAAREQLANVLIHPVVGLTKPGDIDYHTRVKVYKEIIKKYPNGLAALSLLPLAMRMGGDREAVWHAIIRKNYGCTHFIVGRDHAGPGKSAITGKDFYGPYDAQELVEQFKNELEIEVVPFRMVTYLPEEQRYAPIDEVKEGTKTATISGTQLRQKLRDGSEIPEWFSYSEVVKILRNSYPPRNEQGFTLYLTGLPNSGVDSLTDALQATFNQFDSTRHIAVLDHDVEQSALPFIAHELTRSRAAVIIGNPSVAPSSAQLKQVEKEVSKAGSFILISLKGSVHECSQIDRKNYYSNGRQDIKNYVAPENPTIEVDVLNEGTLVSVQKIVLYLEEEGFFKF